MANAPDLTFRNNTAPYAAVSSLSYIQTKESDTTLPVKEGENSDPLTFRIYNNYALNSSIANALNVKITTYDGAGSGSHTASKLPISQMWIHIFEVGFGESGSTPAVFTAFNGTDTAVGGSVYTYQPERGTDGTQSPNIRSGGNGNGAGFLEIKSYASVPQAATSATYNFVVGVDFMWSS